MDPATEPNLEGGTPTQDDERYQTPAEAQARENGWQPEEDYTGNGIWRNAESFNDRGEMIGEVRAAQKSAQEANLRSDKALARNNQFHQMQNNMQIKRIQDLELQLKDTVETGDTEKFEQIQGKIKEEQMSLVPVPALETRPEVDMSESSKRIEQWNADNPWIQEDTPEAAFAKSKFESYLTKNNTPGKDPNILVQGAIKAVEYAMETQFEDQPDLNENRQKASKFSRGRMGGRASRSLTMADLNRDEMGVWQAQKGAYKDEAEFLSAVADSRKGVA